MIIFYIDCEIQKVFNRPFSCDNLQHATLGLCCLICINFLEILYLYLPSKYVSDMQHQHTSNLPHLQKTKTNKNVAFELQYKHQTFNINTHLSSYTFNENQKPQK